jgi:hypothetical protein
MSANGSTNALNTIVAECVEALVRIGDLFSSESAGKALLSRLGWQVGALPAPLLALGKDLRGLKPLLAQARANPDSPDVWPSLSSTVARIVIEIRDLKNKGFGAELDALGFAGQFAEQLLQWTALEQLDRRHPGALAILRSIGVVRSVHHLAQDGRLAYVEERFVLPDFGSFFTSPSTLLRAAWAWGDPAFDGSGMLDEVVAAFRALGVPAGFVAFPPSERELAEVSPGAIRWHVVARFLSGSAAGAAYEAGLRILNLHEGADPALAIVPYVEGTLTEAVAFGDGFDLAIAGAASADQGRALIVAPSVIRFVNDLFGTGAPAAAGEISATLRRKMTEPAELSLGLATIQHKGWSVRAVARSAGADGELAIEFSFTDARVGVPVSDDGLLSSLVGGNRATIPVPLLVGVSSQRGVYVGATGLSLDIPVSLRLGGVEVRRISLKLDGVDRGLATSVTAALVASIGPVSLAVEGLGASLNVRFPVSGGNLGVVDLAPDIKLPTGVGIGVDAAAVSGAGFLFLDSAKGQYAGFLQLNIEGGITVLAVGLIATRLPNGAKGFSFVALITVQGFNPIQLGLGFTLTGIGGILALNRTCNEDVLREGIKNQTLSNILFPKDPIRNAPQIFSSLNAVFPPRSGSYLFGPVVQICWGTPPLLTMDLGLVLELGNRTRLMILGRISAILPSEKLDLIRLQMNTVGIIDFDQKTASVDAVLYDSRLVGKFPLTGAMAMRLSWGASPSFALSIGGFHPAFKPPANFPTLERIAISLSESESFRLRCEAYLAITANTLQFGAHAELYAKAGGFSVEGKIGFDVLIQFDPFAFVAEFAASVQLKHGSTNLFKVKVEGQLSGPRPLHVKGKATFEIFWCDFSVGFDRNLISGAPPPPPAPVVVMEKLKAAINDPRNWGGQLAGGERRLVSLRSAQDANEIVLHPLGRLSVKQTVVPLDLEIAKFGQTTPAGARLFKINAVSVNGKAVGFQSEQDFFSPASFLELTDDEKLAAPSFELMQAGMSLDAGGFLFTSTDADLIEDETIRYETVMVDTEEPPPPKPPSVLNPLFLDQQLSFGAAARCEARRTGTAKYRPVAGKNTLGKGGWTIVSTADQSRQAAPGVEAGAKVTYAEAFQALQALKQESPARAKGLMIIRASEVVILT